ncbi:NAD(+) diphosphatase [Enterovirga sp. DB1703]|uniref:NAD(+) diphosphatase n=2 Tax=Enterovirga aerilata TaxID=2730920 RepID=A0A849IA07_9HYPH|nr:NAD(+) diphosphatase [Enterovirga sp. DB1703]
MPVVAIAGEQAILHADGGRASAVLPAAIEAETPRERVLLGMLEGRPLAGLLYEAGVADRIADAPSLSAQDLRSIAVQGTVPADELGMLAQAKSLLSWHARHRFCANCGNPTEPAAGGLRRDCRACGAQHFPRTDPVSIMLIARGDTCLLGRQKRFVAGSYSCLAGFIAPGETLEDAVRREVLEEAGIRVGRVSYVASQPWPFPSSIMIGCWGEALTEEIVLDRDELEDGRWFHRDELALMLERRHPDGLITPPPMAIANHLMRAWLTGRAGPAPGA